MIVPFDSDKLFKINPNAKVNFENNIIVIDDFFVDYEKVCKYVYHNNVEIWKHSDNSRNFIDYYDCRHVVGNWFYDSLEFDSRIESIIEYFHQLKVKPTKKYFEFNYFKHLKKNVNSNLQMHPHSDQIFNLIVYLDEQCNGGTAIYQIDTPIENNENENLMYDVSSLQKTIIPAKQNRCVIFNGLQYHGGHINNHNVYYDNWRINMVRFYECILPRS